MSETKVQATEVDKIVVNDKFNATDLKYAVDDEIARFYGKESKFTQSHLHTDFKLIVGYVAAFIAGLGALYEYKTGFKEAQSAVAVVCVIYWVLQSILYVYGFFIEKNEIFYGIKKENGKIIGTLKVTAEFDKYSPVYNLTITYKDYALTKAIVYKVKPNMATWFNTKGEMVKEAIDNDLNKFLISARNKAHED
ncbi:signal peptidase complex subunit 2 [Pilobolus umbonatus]|nr:signal peptidase complex subunit 2 [Pilobolus umbonatus]